MPTTAARWSAPIVGFRWSSHASTAAASRACRPRSTAARRIRFSASRVTGAAYSFADGRTRWPATRSAGGTTVTSPGDLDDAVRLERVVGDAADQLDRLFRAQAHERQPAFDHQREVRV